jgi:hypothetical protein
MAVFWAVAPCGLVFVYQRLRGLYCLYHQKIEAAQTSETSVNSYRSTRRHNPEGSHLHSHRREKLSHIHRSPTMSSSEPWDRQPDRHTVRSLTLRTRNAGNILVWLWVQTFPVSSQRPRHAMTFTLKGAPVLKQWNCCCKCGLRTAAVALGWIQLVSRYPVIACFWVTNDSIGQSSFAYLKSHTSPFLSVLIQGF